MVIPNERTHTVTCDFESDDEQSNPVSFPVLSPLYIYISAYDHNTKKSGSDTPDTVSLGVELKSPDQPWKDPSRAIIRTSIIGVGHFSIYFTIISFLPC